MFTLWSRARDLGCFLAILCVSTHALGAAKLVVYGDGVVVYSGPGLKYRPILQIENKVQLRASSQLVKGIDGEYYKVLVVPKGLGKKALGYVNAREKVKLERDDTTEDLSSYRELKLAQSALQAEVVALQNSNYMWTVGYLKYPAPSFFLKIEAGQVLTKISASPLLGLQLGFDQVFFDQVSLFLAVGGGGFFVPESQVLFAGSKNPNYYSKASMGLRYNAGDSASLGVGVVQAAFFNPNNSLLSGGLEIILEVGL